MSFKKTTIRFFYSCDFIKGFLLNPEDFFLSSGLGSFRFIGKYLERKNKKKRLDIIADSVKPLISIILPVYNSQTTIEKAIESIVSQTYTSWELLVIDDGSTDRTLEKLESLSDKDPRIKLHRNAINKGVAYTRNIGLFYAIGEYITFHDADDTSHPERLEYQLSCFLLKPDYKVVIFQYVRVNKDNESYIINGKTRWNRVSGMMVKRQLVKDLGFFKAVTISEDSEYYERILAVYGKKSRKVLCKILYYALFIPDSLLFSNANFKVNGKSINYEIYDDEYSVLQGLRRDHQLIAKGELSPYQPFSPDE